MSMRIDLGFEFLCFHHNNKSRESECVRVSVKGRCPNPNVAPHYVLIKREAEEEQRRRESEVEPEPEMGDACGQ